MAIWQFDLFLVPRVGGMPFLSGEGYDVPALHESLVMEARAYLSRQMGQPWPLLEDWLVFGYENSNRVDLFLTENGGAELSVRIDATSDTESFRNTVCELAERLQCLLFVPELGSPLEPDRAALASALRSSRAAMFVLNPTEALANRGEIPIGLRKRMRTGRKHDA